MKEIGEKLKEARENIGISLEEAAEDLKVDIEKINDLENGNKDSFQDIFNLKYFIRDYAKYLGLNKDDLVDEFNEYLFDYTSKLSLDEIKKESKKEKQNKIKSPYTVERTSERKYQILLYITISFVLITIIFLMYSMIIGDKNKEHVLNGGKYECIQKNCN